MEEEMAHEYYNKDHIPDSNNTSLFHPIDEEAYNDPDNINRQTSMTVPMLEREMFGLYDEDIYSKYYALVADYEKSQDLVIENIEILFSILERRKEILKEVFKSRESVKSNYKRFFRLLEYHYNTLSEVLHFQTFGENEYDFLKMQKINDSLWYEERIALQDAILSICNAKRSELPNLTYEALYDAFYEFHIGSCIEELKCACDSQLIEEKEKDPMEEAYEKFLRDYPDL